MEEPGEKQIPPVANNCQAKKRAGNGITNIRGDGHCLNG